MTHPTDEARCRCGHPASDHEGDLFGRYPCASVEDRFIEGPGLIVIECHCTAFIPRGGA